MARQRQPIPDVPLPTAGCRGIHGDDKTLIPAPFGTMNQLLREALILEDV